MVRQVFSSAILLAAMAAPAAVLAQSSPMPMGSSMPMSGSMSMKMPVCKTGDAVVWVNPKSKAFSMSGAPMYGKSKGGKYMCQSAAMAAGDRPAAAGAMGSMKSTSSPAPGGMMASPGAMASAAPGPVQTGGTTETNAQPNAVNSSSPSP